MRMSKLSWDELLAEVRRRERARTVALRQRGRLLHKLGTIDAHIRRLGGAAGAGRLAQGRIRPRNTRTLTEALEHVLTGKTMSVTEAAEAVRRTGYATNSNNFRTQVNIALIKSGGFKRTGRGQYTAK